MAEVALETMLRRDRIVVAAALVGLAALAWGYVLWLAAYMDMGGMDMTGFRMIPAGLGIMAPATAPWRAIEFAFVFVMWAVMMVGMLLPSAAPMILIYARVGRQAAAEGTPFAATAWFAAGYILAWIGFSLVATVAQWGLERAAFLDARMASASNVLGAVVLIAAGVYQWTPLSSHRSFFWKSFCRSGVGLRGLPASMAFMAAPGMPAVGTLIVYSAVQQHRQLLKVLLTRLDCRGDAKC